MLFNLSGKKALVTGATGGIGASIVRDLKTAGASVLGTGTREEALRQVAQENDCMYLPCDLRDIESLGNFIAKAIEQLGGLDILVCNAGIAKDTLSIRMSHDQWDDVLKINLTSVFFLNKLAVMHMVRKKFGRIINITSVVGHTGNPGQANYTASKAGITGMSKTLALEFASRGITVNCIAPGFIETPMTESLKPSIKQKIIEKIPTGSMGLPEDVSSSVVFLASDASSYITGQVLHVNGGLYL